MLLLVLPLQLLVPVALVGVDLTVVLTDLAKVVCLSVAFLNMDPCTDSVSLELVAGRIALLLRRSLIRKVQMWKPAKAGKTRYKPE